MALISAISVGLGGGGGGGLIVEAEQVRRLMKRQMKMNQVIGVCAGLPERQSNKKCRRLLDDDEEGDYMKSRSAPAKTQQVRHERKRPTDQLVLLDEERASDHPPLLASPFLVAPETRSEPTGPFTARGEPGLMH